MHRRHHTEPRKTISTIHALEGAVRQLEKSRPELVPNFDGFPFSAKAAESVNEWRKAAK